MAVGVEQSLRQAAKYLLPSQLNELLASKKNTVNTHALQKMAPPRLKAISGPSRSQKTLKTLMLI